MSISTRSTAYLTPSQAQPRVPSSAQLQRRECHNKLQKPPSAGAATRPRGGFLFTQSTTLDANQLPAPVPDSIGSAMECLQTRTESAKSRWPSTALSMGSDTDSTYSSHARDYLYVQRVLRVQHQDWVPRIFVRYVHTQVNGINPTCMLR